MSRDFLLEALEEIVGELARGGIHETVPALRDLSAHLRLHGVFEARGGVLVGEHHLRAAPGEAGRAAFAFEAQHVAVGHDDVLEPQLAAKRGAHRPERGDEHHCVLVFPALLERLAARNAGAQDRGVVQRPPGGAAVDGKAAPADELQNQAAATARRAMTLTRWARYSALACRSACMSAGSI